MITRTAPSPDTLRSEAPALRYLLKCYMDDEEFLFGRQAGRLIYFADAHELKAYIDPDRHDHLTGFALEAERAIYERPAESHLQTEVKLKSERLLNELLFEQDGQVILLPPHAEEIDEEIAFHEVSWLRQKIRLLDEARFQVRALRGRTLSGNLIASLAQAAQGGDAASKRRLVQFIQAAAPALLALLVPSPDNPRSRINALVERSNLIRLADVEWEEYGFDAATCARLRELGPDGSTVERWRDYLSTRPGRQRNSVRANRVDAEAVAFLAQLNGELARLAPRARALLVTRAMTLINTVRDRVAARQRGLTPADFLRHPRLLLLATGPAGDASGRTDGRRHAAWGRRDRVTEQALVVALETYERQLREQGRDQLDAMGSEVRSLVETWREFEQARFTFGLQARARGSDTGGPDVMLDENDFRRLLQWLRSDADVEMLVQDNLRGAIHAFGRATYTQSQPEAEKAIPARILRLPQPDRLRVLPIVAGAPGPVHVRAASLTGFGDKEPDLERLMGNLPGPAAERYLAWALLHGCHARWRMSDIYAQSAIESARLQRSEQQRLVADEARLLLAQVRRLRGLDDVDPAHRANEAARRHDGVERQLALISRRQDARVVRERAAQLLELHLTAGPGPFGPPLASGLEGLETAMRLAEGDEVVQAKVAELALTYALALRDRPQIEPGLRVDIGLWHGRLRAAMEALRQGGFHPDELSRRARAMEILGHQMAGEAAAGEGRQPAEALVRSGIPHLLRFGVRELHEQITQRTDEASRLIARELLSVVRRLERYRQQDLIYAPVWTHYGMDAIVAAIEHEEARRAAMQAYELLRELTAGQQPLAGDARERQSLAKAEEELSLAIARLGKPQDEESLRILFYLRMEHCYTQLLASRIEAGEEQRRARLERLGTVYAEISAEYPCASVPHYRRSIVHYELGRRTEAFEAISTALELVGEDPYLTQREHWVRSTIRRRIGVFFGDEASRLMEELKLRPGDGRLRELYLTNVFEAFQAVYTDFTSSASDQERDYLARLEARRRLNNIIYYACLYLEGGGSWITLQRVGFKRETMRRWLARLHDETIGQVPERNIVHTIGCAYQLLGQPQQAREAAERLVQLIVDSGDDPQEDGVGRLLSDAFAWMRADAARQPEAAQPTAVG